MEETECESYLMNIKPGYLGIENYEVKRWLKELLMSITGEQSK